jgi:hypothetical protein
MTPAFLVRSIDVQNLVDIMIDQDFKFEAKSSLLGLLSLKKVSYYLIQVSSRMLVLRPRHFLGEKKLDCLKLSKKPMDGSQGLVEEKIGL